MNSHKFLQPSVQITWSPLSTLSKPISFMDFDALYGTILIVMQIHSVGLTPADKSATLEQYHWNGDCII